MIPRARVLRKRQEGVDARAIVVTVSFVPATPLRTPLVQVLFACLDRPCSFLYFVVNHLDFFQDFILVLVRVLRISASLDSRHATRLAWILVATSMRKDRSDWTSAFARNPESR